MIWFFYNIAFSIVYLLMLPRYFAHMCKRGGYRKGFLQRVGIYDRALKARLQSRRRIWIHAVSVGEIYVALRFMEEVRACRPETAFVLTTTTSTGHAIAARQLDQSDVLLYFPADFPFIVRAVLDCLRPLALVLVECELWPNLIRIAKAKNIPVMLLNGRISERSYRGYAMLRPLVRSILGCFDLLCAQDEENAGRLKELGADRDRIMIMGSAKYDVAEIASNGLKSAGELLLKQAFDSNARVLVGGSTWPGEEAVLLEIYKTLRARFDDFRLVLVPRHAERAGEVMAQIRKSGLSAVMRSALDGNRTADAQSPDVLLVDTTGELKMFYSVATVIFVGKSLTAHGGQNMIEPAVFAKPIVVGPYMENFASVLADFLAADAVIQVENAQGLEEMVLTLWNDTQARSGYGQRARQVVRDKAGAIRASAERCLSLVEPGPWQGTTEHGRRRGDRR